MKSKKRQKRFLILLVGSFVVVTFNGPFMFLKYTVDRLDNKLESQRDRIFHLEKEIEELRLQNKVVKESSYHLKEASSTNTEVYYKIYLKLAMDFPNPLTLYYRATEKDNWQKVQMDMSTGEAQISQAFDSNYDYELKISYLEKGVQVYESLPLLDLYTKEEKSWSSDVQTTKLKGNKLYYNVQIARWNNPYQADLEAGICKVYYDNQLVDEFEILECMALEKQSLPKAVLESEGGQHWFVKRVLTLKNLEDIDPEKVVYDLSIYSHGHVFDRTYDIREDSF